MRPEASGSIRTISAGSATVTRSSSLVGMVVPMETASGGQSRSHVISSPSPLVFFNCTGPIIPLSGGATGPEGSQTSNGSSCRDQWRFPRGNFRFMQFRLQSVLLSADKRGSQSQGFSFFCFPHRELQVVPGRNGSSHRLRSTGSTGISSVVVRFLTCTLHLSFIVRESFWGRRQICRCAESLCTCVFQKDSLVRKW